MQKIVGKYLQKTVGYILLSPALYSVAAFFVQAIFNFDYLSMGQGQHWVAFMMHGNSLSGSTPSLPFYLGLLAIAGAYLIVNDKNP